MKHEEDMIFAAAAITALELQNIKQKDIINNVLQALLDTDHATACECCTRIIRALNGDDNAHQGTDRIDSRPH